MNSEYDLMMKCDLCYDRTSVGKKPMCATVCPSQALFFGTRAEIEKLRPRSQPTSRFHFGSQAINTRVAVLTPKQLSAPYLDVTAALDEPRDSAFALELLDAALFHEEDEA